jgi:Fur family ferric uptake transcriptional regulator
MPVVSLKPKSKADDSPSIRKKLHALNLRGTLSRVAVLQLLQTAAGPLTHAQIADQLTDRGFEHTTIYRNLNELAEAGLLTRLDIGDQAWRFEVTDGGGHLHFFCAACGNISCLLGLSVDKALTAAVKSSVKGVLTEVLLKGRCNACTTG